MRVYKLMGVVAAVFVVLAMLASTTLAVHAKEKKPQDVNGDGKVDIWDLVVVCQALGTDNPHCEHGTGWGKYNSIADICGPKTLENGTVIVEFVPDGKVDIYDLSAVTLAYGS